MLLWKNIQNAIGCNRHQHPCSDNKQIFSISSRSVATENWLFHREKNGCLKYQHDKHNSENGMFIMN